MNAVRLAILLWLASCAFGWAQSVRFTRHEVPWGQPIVLEETGGAPVEVTIRSRQISFISAEIADYRRMIPVLVNDATIYGPSRVVMQPTRRTVRVEKRRGTPIPGGRGEMYLVYIEPRSGTQLYFADETAGQNLDVIFLGTPAPQTQSPAPPEPAASPRAQHARPYADGYLSDELLAWYLRLAKARDSLDLNDAGAVERFNAEVARYHAELKRARAAAK